VVVDPYGLFAKAGIWYLVADCAGVPRMYRLERITTWKEVGQPRRIRENQTLATVAAALVDQWVHSHAIEVSVTIDQAQIGRAERIFGTRLIRDEQGESVIGHAVMIRFLHLEDVRALLPFGNAIIVHGPTEARGYLRALAADLARHYASSPGS
jgi:predicted DNA-binding transcriptional regulator YafY